MLHNLNSESQIRALPSFFGTVILTSMQILDICCGTAPQPFHTWSIKRLPWCSVTVKFTLASLILVSPVHDWFGSSKQWHANGSPANSNKWNAYMESVVYDNLGEVSVSDFSYLFRFHLSCCEVFNTVQKAAFCKSIVSSQELLKLQRRSVLIPRLYSQDALKLNDIQKNYHVSPFTFPPSFIWILG